MDHIKEKTGGFLAEFRKFIARGNVMDLAVGVIIGGAFKGITDSLVSDILNPILGIFAGGNDNFLIMAFVIFCLVKAMNRLYRKKEEAPAAPPAPSKEEVLLTEIRDLLKAQKEEN